MKAAMIEQEFSLDELDEIFPEKGDRDAYLKMVISSILEKTKDLTFKLEDGQLDAIRNYRHSIRPFLIQMNLMSLVDALENLEAETSKEEFIDEVIGFAGKIKKVIDIVEAKISV